MNSAADVGLPSKNVDTCSRSYVTQNFSRFSFTRVSAAVVTQHWLTSRHQCSVESWRPSSRL